MSYSDSQKQTIYRRLTEYIQLGFYDDNVRFPTAMEIAKQFDVSYCPAQQALKELEQAGIIKICRGAKTIIRKKPYENYLESNTFQERVVSLLDLCQSIQILSPVVTLQGMHGLKHDISQKQAYGETDIIHYWKKIYWIFKQTLEAMGSKTLLSLYYDMGASIGSAFIDIFRTVYGKSEEKQLLHDFEACYVKCFQNSVNGDYNVKKNQIADLSNRILVIVDTYLKDAVVQYQTIPQKDFIWTPHKGRTKYCDLIACDLIRKIIQGVYPVGTRLPNGQVLAEIYHVSAITMRRTINLLNKLGFTKTTNGVGTYVILAEDTDVLSKFELLKLDDSLRTFLEALQLLAITFIPVFQITLPYFTDAARQSILDAVESKKISPPAVATISACLQAIVHCCPLKTIQEIYRNITILLLNGNVLQYSNWNVLATVDWQAISKTLAASLTAEDSKRFAVTFYRFIESIFIFYKENLCKVGVKNIEQIAAPIYFE